MKSTKTTNKQKIQFRIRKKVSGVADRPRLAVYRSNKSIYCQLIDDSKSITLAAASAHADVIDKAKNKTEQPKAVGLLIADRAKSLNIESVVFDRGGNLYHGRIKALAEGAREGGLKF